jgi:hypothetical protein
LEKAIVKVLRLAVISGVGLVLLLNTAAFGQPSPQVNQPTSATGKTAPINNSSQTDNSLCYIQLTNGKTINLSQLCGPTSDSSRLTQTYSQPPTVYNDSAIKAFDESVYGPEG